MLISDDQSVAAALNFGNSAGQSTNSASKQLEPPKKEHLRPLFNRQRRSESRYTVYVAKSYAPNKDKPLKSRRSGLIYCH